MYKFRQWVWEKPYQDLLVFSPTAAIAGLFMLYAITTHPNLSPELVWHYIIIAIIGTAALVVFALGVYGSGVGVRKVITAMFTGWLKMWRYGTPQEPPKVDDEIDKKF